MTNTDMCAIAEDTNGESFWWNDDYPSVLVHNPHPLLYPVWIPLLNGPLQFASVSEENAHG